MEHYVYEDNVFIFYFAFTSSQKPEFGFLRLESPSHEMSTTIYSRIYVSLPTREGTVLHSVVIAKE